MTIRRTRSLLWLTTVGLLAAAAVVVAVHLTQPVRLDTAAEAPSQERVPSQTPHSDQDRASADHAALLQIAGRDIRQQLFDPPVVEPKPPPPKPLPPIELLSTILRSTPGVSGETSGASGAAWVRDGQTTRKVIVGDTIGPDNNPATITAIEANRLILDHEGREVEVTHTTSGGGGRR